MDGFIIEPPDPTFITSEEKMTNKRTVYFGCEFMMQRTGSILKSTHHLLTQRPLPTHTPL